MNATPLHDPFDPSSTFLRPLGEYRDRLPSRRSGRRLTRSTLYRWALRGTRGGRVTLKTVRIGGGIFTCDQFVHEFMRALDVHEPVDQHGDPIDLQAQANAVAANWNRQA